MIPAVRSLEEEVSAILSDELHLAVPSPQTDLLASGTLDSLLFVELLLQLERRFGLRVDMEHLELDAFRSVESIAALVAGSRSPGA